MDTLQFASAGAADPSAIARAVEAAGGPAVVARQLGVTTQAVCFWRNGERAVPEKHGAGIERACGGAVTRKEMWPETWRRIWPELADKVDQSTSVAGEGG